MPVSGEMSFISVEMKKASQVDFVRPLMTFVNNEFGEAPEGFEDAVKELTDMRNKCVVKSAEKHESGLRAVMKYYGTLQCLERRFPFKTAEEWDGESVAPIILKFSWEDTVGGGLFGSKLVGLKDMNFETICTLYNIGALHTQIGVQANTSSDSGLKNASINFQNAAVVFNAVAKSVHKFYTNPPSGDLDPNYLSALSFLMLAQSQEMFWKKCVVERKSNGLIAKLAKQTAAFYNDSYKNMALAANLDKQWVKVCQAKGAYYEADAHYRMSFDQGEEGNYGEQIAHLKTALSFLATAAKPAGSTKFNISRLEDSVASALRSAEKDNSMIYMQSIPRQDSLAPLAQTATVSAEKPLPDFTQPEYIGSDPFSNVVPVSVSQAVTRYKQARAQHISSIVSDLAECTGKSIEKMVALGLPGSLQAAQNPDTVPQGLLQQGQEIRNSGGASALQETINSLPERSQACRDLVQDIMSSLDKEQREDDELRSKYGAKWDRETSTKLNQQMRNEVQKFASHVERAAEGDHTVEQRFRDLEPALNFLAQDESEIRAALPTGTNGGDGSSDVVGELMEILTRLDELRASRDAMSDKYDELVKTDDISGVLVEKLSTTDESSLFDEQMKVYTNLDEEAKGLIAETEDCVSRMENANERFVGSKSESSDRELMLNDLNSKFEAWKILTRDIQEGGKFYTQIASLLERQQAKCNDYCMARDLEKKELMSAITRSIASSNAETYPAQQPQQQYQPPPQQYQPPSRQQQYQPPPRQQQQYQPPQPYAYTSSAPPPHQTYMPQGSYNFQNYGPPQGQGQQRPYGQGQQQQQQQHQQGGYNYGHYPPRF
eukprot:m.4283 g.4283  ORF g.4283 m.4283 type:complete len:832 (+) comp3854_c0_seq1:1357-3852(+)